MSKTLYVFSTLAADQNYTGYRKGGAEMQIVEKQVFINGRAGVIDKRGVDTPLGVVTKVSEEDVKWLQDTNVVFQRHVANGFITIKDSAADAGDVAADMNRNDPGRQLTDDDYANANKNEAKPQKGKK